MQTKIVVNPVVILVSLSKKGIQLLRLNCCNVVIKNTLCGKKSVAVVTLKVVMLNIYSYKLVLVEKICISISFFLFFFIFFCQKDCSDLCAQVLFNF